VALLVAAGNRLLDRLPPNRWLYRRQLFRGLEWTDVDLPLPESCAGLDGFRAVFLSDLHLGSFLTEADMVRLLEMASARDPDVVLFGGDLVHTRPREIEAWRRPLAGLRAPHGVFAVPGNHERFRGIDVEVWRRRMGEFGVEVLMNRGVRLSRDGASLWLAGVDDLTEGAPDLDRALLGRRAGEPTLLLSHHPDLFPHAAAADVDLTLSGHTHGGQIAPFGWMPVRHSELGFHQGLFERDGSSLYVGRGIGAVILPLRIGSRPEVPVVGCRVRPGQTAATAAFGARTVDDGGSCGDRREIHEPAPVSRPERD
jgi:predicted MPP superfamily phosphohydrolase